MKEVKILGMNATPVKEDSEGNKVRHAVSAPLLHCMSDLIKYDGGSYSPLQDLNSRRPDVAEKIYLGIRKLENLYKNIKEEARGNLKLQKIQSMGEGAYVTKGMAWHNIPAGDDGIEILLERFKSIKDNGLLAVEWFDEAYGENEVAYCVSFHKALKNSLVKDLKQWPGREKLFNSFSTGKEISIFIDFENPLLKPLVDVVPAQVEVNTLEEFYNLPNSDIIDSLNRVDLLKAIIKERDLKETKERIYCDWEKGYPLSADRDEMKEFLSNRGVKSRLSDSAHELIKEFFINKYGDRENFLELKMKEIENSKQQNPPYRRLYYGYTACGVPSKFINGIALTKEFENNKEFISKLQEVFPNAKIFNKEGIFLNKKQKLFE